LDFRFNPKSKIQNPKLKEVRHAVALDFNELRQLLVTIAQTDIAELTLKSDDFELTVRKAAGASNQLMPTDESTPNSLTGLGLTSTPAATQLATTGMETVSSRVVDTTVSATVQMPIAAPSSLDKRLVEVPSPMVGTFYRSPSPGEQPFVEVGDRVRIGQTVCIIEAMKLMNEIEAEVSGQIMEIIVPDGEPVEYGQPLMRINPD
jgi:acetyl-CoA carboxylase biotin carboxyl carrier protein